MTGAKKKPHSSLAAESAVQSGESRSEHSVYQSVRPSFVSDGSTGSPGASIGGPAAGEAEGGRGGRVTVDDYLAWLSPVFSPTAFLTLTYDNRYSEMPAEWVRSTWKWLVHRLNLEVGGPNYRRKFKHSYFSYVMALEFQKRGALHIHALVDNWIDFPMVHHLWSPKFGGRYGFAWISKVPNPKLAGVGALKASSVDVAMRYVLKYVLKDGSPLVWIRKKRIDVRHVDLRSSEAAPGALSLPSEWHWRVVDDEQLSDLHQLEFGADGTAEGFGA